MLTQAHDVPLTAPTSHSPQHRYDAALGCFVLPNTATDGNDRLAFCQHLSQLTDGDESFYGRLADLLDVLVSDRQFTGATVRIGVCANPSMDRFVVDHIATAVELAGSGKTVRNEILEQLMRDEARHLVESASSPNTHQPSTSNFQYFISGSVPLIPHESERSLSILQGLKKRVFWCLYGVSTHPPSVDDAQYAKLVDTMLKSTSRAPGEFFDGATENGCRAASEAYGFRINPATRTSTNTATTENYVPVFDVLKWGLGPHEGLPKHFVLTTSFHIAAHSGHRRISSLFPAILRRGDTHNGLLYTQELKDAAEQGEGIVAVDVCGYGLGESIESAELESRRFIRFMRAQGFAGEFLRLGPAPVQSALPLCQQHQLAASSTLVTTGKAASFAPTMSTMAHSDRAGLRLMTHLGQPTYFDFMSTDNTPLTVVTGAAGSGKSYLTMAMATHCLSQRMSVFAISDNTFGAELVTQLGGYYFGRDRAAGTHLSPFNLRKNGDNHRTIELAVAYTLAIASLSAVIPQNERTLVTSWFERQCTQWLDSSDTDLGIDLPQILSAMHADKLDVPTLLDALHPFSHGSAYSHLMSLTWPTDLAREEFSVVHCDHGLAGWATPRAVAVAAYLTKVALARNMFDRPDLAIPALLIFEEVDDLLHSTTEAGLFLLQVIRDSRKRNCAVVATVRSGCSLYDTPSGQRLGAMAQHLVCLPHKPEFFFSKGFQALFHMSELQSQMGRAMRTKRGHYAEMLIHSRGHVGFYRLCPGPFARALCEQAAKSSWDVEKQVQSGSSYLQALEYVSTHERIASQKDTKTHARDRLTHGVSRSSVSTPPIGVLAGAQTSSAVHVAT